MIGIEFPISELYREESKYTKHLLLFSLKWTMTQNRSFLMVIM